MVVADKFGQRVKIVLRKFIFGVNIWLSLQVEVHVSQHRLRSSRFLLRRLNFWNIKECILLYRSLLHRLFVGFHRSNKVRQLR